VLKTEKDYLENLHMMPSMHKMAILLMTSEDILDPFTLKVFVIDLNGWMFAVDAAGSDPTT
jgi:hypothetical protein